MPRFFIIDQSLCKAAGHHFDYTRNLALAAADKQYQSVVGANREFKDPDPSPFAADSLRSCFTNTTYCSLSELHGLRSLTRSLQPPSRTSQGDGWLAGRRYNKHARLREAYVEQFRLDCRTFFGNWKFTAEDQVFFVTVSELECEGLARFLAETPSASLASWHLQFHFELFPAAATEIEANRWIESQRPLFQDMRRFKDCVFFYATSDGLSEQYNRLDTFRFETLAYPVNAGFFEHRDAKHGKIQVACFGGIRREKGLKTLAPRVVDSLAKDANARDQIELVVQGKPSELPKSIRDSDVIRWVPLPAENYVDLVHEAAIGLLYYDRETFAKRVSSTLNEFLCAGKPVIVSSGSWLHEKIMPAIAEYQLSMFERSKIVWSSTDVGSETSSITIPLDGFEKPHRLICIKGKAVSRACERTGASPRLCMDVGESVKPLVNASPNELGPGASAHPLTVSYTSASEETQTLFACCADVSAEAEQVKLTFSTAAMDSPIELSQFTLLEIGVLETESTIPKSQVGIAIANEEDVFAAIKHVAEHLDHFHRTACEFSQRIQSSHRPATTFEQLLRRSDLRRL